MLDLPDPHNTARGSPITNAPNNKYSLLRIH